MAIAGITIVDSRSGTGVGISGYIGDATHAAFFIVLPAWLVLKLAAAATSPVPYDLTANAVTAQFECRAAYRDHIR